MRAALMLVLVLAAEAHAAVSTPGSTSDQLFTNPGPRRISITVPPEGLTILRTNARTYVSASVREGTNAPQNVAIHLKGSTGSFRRIDDKPGLTLDFDRYDPSQRFHGLSKIHLNNSVEDASYLHELLGSEAFRRAGIPAARVGHAIVELNGRPLGLYVLKEGFTSEFLAHYFTRPNGNLYEPGKDGRDVDEPLDLQLGDNRRKEQDLEQLATVAGEPDLSARWRKLPHVLDVDRFVAFMAMEILTGHRDGYCLARNNFRVYQDAGSGRMFFFPHGMDQLFGYAKLPIEPRMSGLVARSIMEMPEGRQRFRDECSRLLREAVAPAQLTARVDEKVAALAPELSSDESAALVREGGALKERIVQRLASVEQQLRQAPLEMLRFTNEVATLPNWQPVDVPAAGAAFRTNSPDGKSILLLRAGPVTSASWRSKVILPPGKYRFEGVVRTLDVAPLSFGKNHGAALRVAHAGATGVSRWIGTQTWKDGAVSFELTREQEIELVCELRASRGQAWFDVNSLRLHRLE
jgi:spore coat protein H